MNTIKKCFIIILFSLSGFFCREESISPVSDEEVKITLVSPVSSSSCQDIIQKLEWAHDLKDANSLVNISTDSTFKTNNKSYSTKGFSFLTDTLNMGTKYYWFVNVTTSSGKEYKSEIRSFVTPKFSLNGKMKIIVKSAHNMDNNGSIISVDDLVFDIDCRNNEEYRTKSSFTFSGNKFNGEYHYGSPIITRTNNVEMEFITGNLCIKNIDVNYHLYDTQTLRSDIKYVLNLVNIPIFAITDTSFVYKINGKNCSKSMSFSGNYQYGVNKVEYKYSDWSKDSYILVELKK